MRARSILYYAVEQKESWSIRGAASHIRQGVNDRKPAPNGGFIPDFLPRFSTAGPRFSTATEENLYTVEKRGLIFSTASPF